MKESHLEKGQLNNPFKELLGFNHPVFVLVLKQDLVIFAERNTEDDCSDTLKQMNPLPPFVPLAPNIK